MLHTFALIWDQVRVYFWQFTMTRGQQTLVRSTRHSSVAHGTFLSLSHSVISIELLQLFHNHPIQYMTTPRHDVDNVFKRDGGRNRHIAASRSSTMSSTTSSSSVAVQALMLQSRPHLQSAKVNPMRWKQLLITSACTVFKGSAGMRHCRRRLACFVFVGMLVGTDCEAIVHTTRRDLLLNASRKKSWTA